MPEFTTQESFAITITFRPQLKTKERFRRIKMIRQLLRQQLNLRGYSFKAAWSIEYHKFKGYMKMGKYVPHEREGESNPMAPHVHMLLQVEDELKQRHIDAFNALLHKKFGRTSFDQIHTRLDFDKWHGYIQKDVAENNSRYGIEHWFTYELVSDDSLPEFDTDIEE